MKPTTVCTIVLLALAAETTACHKTATPYASVSEVAVEQVLANPRAYSHRLVTIRGCYVSSFERSTLQPCREAALNEFIWVDDAAMIHTVEQLQPPGIPSPEPPELRTPTKSVLVFQYDASKNRAAWEKLVPEPLPYVYRSEVTLVGQFETIAPQEPGPIRSGFGHLGAFRHELILVDVLRSKALNSGR